MQSTYLYVAAWEDFNDIDGCVGGDLFYSLDPDLAMDFLRNHPDAQSMVWDEENEMYIERDEYGGWQKLYVDMRPLNEEL